MKQTTKEQERAKEFLKSLGHGKSIIEIEHEEDDENN